MTVRTFQLALAIATACIALPSAATPWLFTQSGFSGGGTLSGSFAGTDLNQDGWVVSADGEVVDFQAMFSGDQFVPTITFGTPQLGGLVYRVGSHSLGGAFGPAGAEGLFAESSSHSLLSGLGVAGMQGSLVADLASGGTSITTLEMQVSPVPEPSSAWLMVLGVIGVLARLSCAADRRQL